MFKTNNITLRVTHKEILNSLKSSCHWVWNFLKSLNLLFLLSIDKFIEIPKRPILWWILISPCLLQYLRNIFFWQWVHPKKKSLKALKFSFLSNFFLLSFKMKRDGIGNEFLVVVVELKILLCFSLAWLLSKEKRKKWRWGEREKRIFLNNTRYKRRKLRKGNHFFAFKERCKCMKAKKKKK